MLNIFKKSQDGNKNTEDKNLIKITMIKDERFKKEEFIQVH